MNHLNSFTASSRTVFRPAASFLSRIVDSKRPSKPFHSRLSTDGIGVRSSDDRSANMEGSTNRLGVSSLRSSSEGQTGTLPLIELSRTPSPYPRSRSGVQSEDEDDDFEQSSTIRPLVASDIGSAGRSWRRLLHQGGLGSFFFGTWFGWQVYVGLLVFWVGGCGFGLLLMNRFILWTGVYKFPYPLTATYLQLLITHLLIIGFASLTRGLSRPLHRLGLGAAVAPSTPSTSPGGGFRGAGKKTSLPSQFFRWLSNGSGGIAGGGLFEFDQKIARKVLPLAGIYIGKVVLSNLSFAYAVLPMFTLARIGVIPLSLLFTSMLTREIHSVPTLSASLTATLNLLLASIRPGVRVTWESIVAGVFSSIFVALYPIVLLRTYRLLVADLVPQGDVLNGFAGASDDTPFYSSHSHPSTSREETRAYWRTLHYTSLLSLGLLTPLLLVSGELGNILRNCYFLDVPFFWFLTLCGGIGGWAVFASTLLLARATSPLTVTFLAAPRGAFQLVMLSHFKMPAHSWVGIVLCWLASLWYLATKRREGRSLERLRLEGR